MPCKKQERKSGIKALIVGLFACAACCTLPLIATVGGSALLIGLAAYTEKIAVGILIVGISLASYWYWRSKHAPHCSTACGCKTET